MQNVDSHFLTLERLCAFINIYNLFFRTKQKGMDYANVMSKACYTRNDWLKNWSNCAEYNKIISIFFVIYLQKWKKMSIPRQQPNQNKGM